MQDLESDDEVTAKMGMFLKNNCRNRVAKMYSLVPKLDSEKTNKYFRNKSGSEKLCKGFSFLERWTKRCESGPSTCKEWKRGKDDNFFRHEEELVRVKGVFRKGTSNDVKEALNS